MEVVTKGGYHILVAPKGNTFETLAVGPHRAVARHIAAKHHKSIKWTELSKGDWIAPEDYAHLVPKYEQITADLQKREQE